MKYFYVDVVSIMCMILMIMTILVIIINLCRKDKSQRVSYLRNFKKGQGAVIYIFSIPLFFIGYFYVGHNWLDSCFYAIRKGVELIVLRYDISPIKTLIEENAIYSTAIYLCYILVCLNAIIFIFSLMCQFFWRSYMGIRFMFSKKDKVIIFGNNANNHIIYKSVNDKLKLLVDKISNEDSLKLYKNNILYKDVDSYKSYIKYIVSKSVRSEYVNVIIINTEIDTKNIQICHEFINQINKLDERERYVCFAQLRIFTYGNPKYDTIYEEIMSNSFGCISYINKYKKIAVDIIEKHPFSLYLDSRFIDYKTSLLNNNFDINALLIGFGKTNQQFFLTSIANNQFMEKKDVGIDIKKINYHLFDNQPSDNSKVLNHNYNRYKNEFEQVDEGDYLQLPSHPAETTFHKLDINDTQFYNEIRYITSDSRNSVNFIVISFGSDLENLDLAQKLLCKMKEWSIDNYLILVKVRDCSNNIKFLVEDRCFIVGNESNCVYNIDSILEDKLLKMGQMRDEVYALEYELTQDATSLTNERILEIRRNAYRSWYMKKTQLERESSIYCCLSMRSKLNLMGLDICSIDDKTKRALTEDEYLDIYAHNDLPNQNHYSKKLDGKSIIYYSIDYKDSLRKNFAIMEHLRWNAFMISKGMIPASRNDILNETNSLGKYTNGKNYMLRRHGCLTTFEGLIEFRKIVANRDKKNDEQLQDAENRADVIKYDYQLMDDAYWLLTKSGYKIIKKDKNIPPL